MVLKAVGIQVELPALKTYHLSGLRQRRDDLKAKYDGTFSLL